MQKVLQMTLFSLVLALAWLVYDLGKAETAQYITRQHQLIEMIGKIGD